MRRRRSVVAVIVLAVILVGGIGAVLQDARGRVAAARAEVQRVSETQFGSTSFTP